MTQAAFHPGPATGNYNPADVAAYIQQVAPKYGIDPNIALRVAQSEGLNNPVGDQGKSFGPFQLYTGGGLGNSFQQQTGLNPADFQNNWQAQVNFALQWAAENGWNPGGVRTATGATGGGFHGATVAGISNWEGIHQQIQTLTTDAATFKDTLIPATGATDDFTQSIASVAGSMKPLDDSMSLAGETTADLGTTAQTTQGEVATSTNGLIVDAMSFANQFGISIDAANKILLDHGSVATQILGKDIPANFQATDFEVEQFADAFKITWDDARTILNTSGATFDAVMGKQIPDANQQTQDALKKTQQAHDDLKPKVTDVKDAMSSLAKDGFETANKAQGQLATDMATQVSFVLQQLDDKMPDLIQQIKDFITQLNNIPRDIEVNIHTNGSVEASAGAGGGGGDNGGGGGDTGGGSGGGGDSGTFGYSPSNPSPHPGESGPGGIYNDPHTGQPYPFAEGGVLSEPVFGVGRSGRTYTFAESGPEWFGGVGKSPIDYDLLATNIAMAITQVNLSVSVDDIHTGLLKKQRRNGNLGWVTQ
jgi:uncharacterized membrane protein YgcG